MNLFRIIPQIRNNCVIQGNKEFLSKFKVGDAIFLVSSNPAKKYSIISKIERIEHGNDSIIIIDKRILEKLGENDEVSILKYNPAEAIEIHLVGPNSNPLITSGEHTATIKPHVLNKLVDYGQEISFLISLENEPPIVATGMINSTIPPPPVYIGPTTRIFLENVSEKEFGLIKKDLMEKKEKRASVLEKQIRKKTLNLIKHLKLGTYRNMGQKYSFKSTNPRQLFKAILNIFKGFEFIEEPREEYFSNDKNDYLGSAVFLLNDDIKNIQMIDIQVLAHGNSGLLILWISAKDENKISEILDQYDPIIRDLKQGLEQKVEILSVRCPECGGALPINEANSNGIVECKYCNFFFRIPKILRYQ